MTVNVAGAMSEAEFDAYVFRYFGCRVWSLVDGAAAGYVGESYLDAASVHGSFVCSVVVESDSLAASG